MNRILYSGTRNASSWAFRAWLALKEAGVPFEEKIVDIRLPQRIKNLAEIGAFSPPAAVPVLVDGGVVIFDSLSIMEYANELCGGNLLPAGRMERARARSMTAWQHSGLSAICPQLSFESAFYPEKRALSEDERESCRRLYNVWDSELAKSGGPFLFGGLSLADLAFVPTIIRIMSHDDSAADWPRVHEWAARLLARDHVAFWMREAEAAAPVILDDYYVRR